MRRSAPQGLALLGTEAGNGAGDVLPPSHLRFLEGLYVKG